MALRAQSACIRRVNRAAVAVTASTHSQIRLWRDGEQYISLTSTGEYSGHPNVAKQSEWQRQVEELQSQMAFQEDTVRALNEALVSQQQEMLILRRQLELLKQRLDEQGQRPDDGPGAAEEKPPHY